MNEVVNTIIKSYSLIKSGLTRFNINMNRMMFNKLVFILILCLSLLLNLTGIRWGLPSKQRAELVLPTGIDQGKLFEDLAITRSKMYETFENNATAYHGRIKMSGKIYYNYCKARIKPIRIETVKGNIPEPILHSLSSYLVRSGHPDEQSVLAAIAKMKPQKLDFNPHAFYYGGIYFYSIAAFLKVADIFGFIKITPDIKYYYSNPDEMGKFFVVGRFVTVLAIFISLILIYIITKDLYDDSTALLAMFLFTISPVVVVNAHIMKPHFFALPFSCLTFYYAKKILDSGSFKYYILSGVFLGLTTGITYNNFWTTGWIIILSHLLYSFRNGRNKIKDIFNEKIFSVFILSILVFIVANPYIISSAKEFYEELIWVGGSYALGFNLRMFYNFIKVSLFYSLGTGLWILVLLGLTFCLYKTCKGNRSDTLIILYLVPVILFGCTIASNVTALPDFLRFMPIGIVMFCIVASRFVIDLYKTNKLTILIVTILIFVNLLNAIGYSYCFYLDNPTTANNLIAGRWINANIKKGSSIGIMVTSPHVDSVPPFRFTDYSILSFGGVRELGAVEYLPEYFIVPEIFETVIMAGYKDYVRWNNFNEHYTLIKYFKKDIKFSILHFRDMISVVDYPVRIYKRK